MKIYRFVFFCADLLFYRIYHLLLFSYWPIRNGIERRAKDWGGKNWFCKGWHVIFVLLTDPDRFYYWVEEKMHPFSIPFFLSFEIVRCNVVGSQREETKRCELQILVHTWKDRISEDKSIYIVLFGMDTIFSSNHISKHSIFSSFLYHLFVDTSNEWVCSVCTLTSFLCRVHFRTFNIFHILCHSLYISSLLCHLFISFCYFFFSPLFMCCNLSLRSVFELFDCRKKKIHR